MSGPPRTPGTAQQPAVVSHDYRRHAEILNGNDITGLGQHADDHRLTVKAGLDLDAQVIADATRCQLGTSPLWQAFFRDVHVAPDFYDIDQATRLQG